MAICWLLGIVLVSSTVLAALDRNAALTSNIKGLSDMSTIQFVDHISPELESKMRKDLIRYESSHGVDVNYRYFSLILTDENGEEIGVLNAYTAFAEIHIDDLWVDAAHRGKGYGKKLIQTLEDHFRNKGFNN